MLSSLPAVRFCGSLPRVDSGEPTCEDYALYNVAGGILRAAVSDGASDSFLPSEWARVLCMAYCFPSEATNPDSGLPTLAALRASWEEATSRASASSPLPWYALEERRKRGSAATLLGISVSPDHVWTAIAVGDSCLFQVRDEALLASFPLQRFDDFNALPVLIGTAQSDLPPVHHARGAWQTGDDLFLATDALAAWFLHENSRKNAPWKWFRDLGNSDRVAEFARRIATLRESGRLRNDDVSLVYLRAESV